MFKNIRYVWNIIWEIGAGPCEGLHKEEEYNKQIIAIREILKGNFKESLQEFKKQMKAYATKMEYEKAHVPRKR